MTTAIYAGSYDPFTYGHVAVAVEAQKIFRRVIVAVGENNSKQGLFSAVDRMTVARRMLVEVDKGPPDKRFEVTSFTGLLADYAAMVGQGEHVVLVRGLRMVSDFESEMTIAAANRKLNPLLSTIFIPTLPDVAFVSSSVVKEIARHTKTVENLLPYVPRDVGEELIRRLQPVKAGHFHPPPGGN